MTKIIPTLCLLFLWGGAHAQGPAALTLQEAIDYAWANSTAIKNAGINISDADQQIYERRATGLPQLTGNLNYQRYLKVPVQVLPDAFVDLISLLNPGAEVNREASFFLNNNFSASVNLDAMLFDGSYFTALKAARAYRAYVQRELEVQRREVKTRVFDAYLPVLLLDKNLEILDRNIGNLEQLFFETSELYKAGFAEQLDVDRQELSLANLRVEREKLEGQRTIALNALKLTLNFPMDRELTLESELDDLEVALENEALTGTVNYQARPEVSLIEQGLQLNDLNIQVNKAAYYPTARVFGTYQQNWQGNNAEDGFWAPTTFVGLTVNVPIFDGFDKRSKIERARLQKELTLNQKQDLEKAIWTEVHNARLAYLNARKSLDAQKKNLELAERIYATTQIKYREGVGSSLEMTQAEQSLYTSQSNYLQALYEAIVAKVAVEIALGK